jgi:hypothetical protein
VDETKLVETKSVPVKRDKRDFLIPPKPGEVRNPTGRPKQAKEFALWAREKSLDLGMKLFDMACNASKDADKIKAIELILAYGIGKPIQQIDLQTTRPIIIAPGILPADYDTIEPTD